MMRSWSRVVGVASALVVHLAFTSHAFADDEPRPATAAAPLPSKDIRWSALLGGAADVGSLPHASPGAVVGFDVRRGALGLRAVTSAFLPQTAYVSGASGALFDLMAMICALAPFGGRFDAGACGGLGVGLLRGEQRAIEPHDSGFSLRPQGLAMARLDVTLFPELVLTLDAGTVIDPLRTPLPVTGIGDAHRSSLFSFRGALGVLVRLW